MSLARVNSRAQLGITAPPVTVEVHITNGLPALAIVGLPETAVREAKDRVRSALINSGFEFPARRLTVNLAPADLPKEGGRYDLAIALGILAASGQLPSEPLTQCEVIGELALSGELRPVPGALCAALACRDLDRTLLLPSANAAEARLVEGATVRTADHLLAICRHLSNSEPLPADSAPPPPVSTTSYPDLADVRGQFQAKRALEICAAGNHSLLMSGPPGSGKTMLASRLPGLLPPPTEQERLEIAALQSVARGGFDPQQWRQRPFRAPHHTASAVALVGGGSNPKPGEISLAHAGVLFLDELPEFDRKVLEVLREPLESGEICISRAARQVNYPARFQLVAAMNPCACGHYGDTSRHCRCTAEQVRRYQGKISGPLLDRLDLHVEVAALKPDELVATNIEQERSDVVRQRVRDARQRQLERQGCLNAHLDSRAIEQQCELDDANRGLLSQALQRLGLSARAYHRVLRVARTLADLEGETTIARHHLLESLSYRKQERTGRVRTS